MLHKLIFDTTDATTVADTHSVGAYVRSGKSGALVTHHGLQKLNAITFSFVDGDVTPGSDAIAETAHGLQTGDRVQLTNSGGALPAGLATVTDYYIIRVNADAIKLASNEHNAEWGIPVDITAAAGGGTHTLTGFETEGRSLDVWLSNPSIAISDGGGSITVDATNLDIRDLVFATDKVDVSGSEVSLDAATLLALETITVNQGTSPWVVSDASNYAEDSAHVTADIGKFVLAVRRDADTPFAADGDYTPFATDAQGRLKVAAEVSVQAGDAEFLEDSAHTDADAGIHMLAVRQDTLASSVSTDGDYASLKVNSLGRLYVDVGTVTTNDAALANSAIAAAAETLDVANTAQNIIVSPLSSRKYLWVYNNDNKKIFIGQSGVTSANGFPVAPGSYMEMRAGAAVDIEFVSDKINHEIRTLEIS